MRKPTFEGAALLSIGAAAAGAVTIAAIGDLPPGWLLAQAAVLGIGIGGSALELRGRKVSTTAGLLRIAEATGVPQAAESETALIGALTHRLAAANERRLPAVAARACDTPMTVFDADDRPVFLNQSFVSFARDLKHVFGERSSDPKAAATELLRHLRKRGAKALSRRGEAVEFTVEGATFEAVMSPLEGEDDHSSLCVTWRDVTAVAEARQLIEMMDTANFRFTLDAYGRIIDANEIAAERLGRRADDVLGERMEALFSSEDGLPDWRDMTPGEAIHARLLPHGSDEEIGATLYPLAGSDGRLARTLCIGSPSRRGNPRAAAVLAAIGSAQAVIEFDAEGSVIGASDGACAVLGQTADALQGQSHAAICGAPPSDAARTWERLKSGSPVDLRTAWPAREGARTLKVSYVPVMGEDARLESVLCCLTDLTEESERLRMAERTLADDRKTTEAMISGLEAALERLAGGNLDCFISEPFPERLEPVCRRFNEAVERQCDAFSRLLGSAETLRRSAEEAGAAAGEMARRTESQASTLEQSAAALEQLTINVKASTARNDQFETEVQGAMANATAAGSVVEEAFGAINEIESSSRQISRIIGVIDDIAFQTNLLALNAGVEAARAGDAGRGFAVVASEVRALAQRSSEAAKEIKALISLSAEQVARGVEVVGQGGSALKEVIASVHSIATMVAEVAASARDQSSGLGEIATAVSALDQTTQQTAAMVEESTAAGASLVHQAEGLLSIAATFHLPQGRHQRPPVVPRVPKATVTRLAPAKNGSAALKVVDEDDWTEF